MLKTHGRRQVEIKLSYPLGPGSVELYRTDLYLFAPDKLNLTRDTYPKEQVLQDSVLYVRATSPRIALEDLVNERADQSPLTRLRALLSRPEDPGRNRGVIY